MNDLIRRIIRWLALLLGPLPHCPDEDSRPSFTPSAPVPLSASLPRLRSPFGREPHTVDAGGSPLVRPYLAAHERECVRERRRLALVLAADFGIDLDLDRDRSLAGMPGVAC